MTNPLDHIGEGSAVASASSHERDAAFLMSHPLVLRTAWERARSWYFQADFVPEPEFSEWTLFTDDKLQALSAELAAGTYRPDPFPLRPYPKSYGTTRHFSPPSVRDQVAFSVFSVLLAPLLETRMSSFSFGNRSFRGVHRSTVAEDGDEGARHSRWTHRPFSLKDRAHYQPYSRGHGLFRRVAHWSVKAMLGDGRATGSGPSVEDYAADMLPPFTRSGWWQRGGGKRTRRGYWARMDLQMAFPSVPLDRLRERMVEMVADSDEGESDVRKAWEAFPWDLRKALRRPEVRRALVERWMDLLNQVEIERGDQPDEWHPPHADQRLPMAGSPHKGLPTALAVSPLLLNVYLHSLDERMATWTGPGQRGHRRAAFLRFADDFIVIAVNPLVLAAAVDEVWRGLTGSDDATLARICEGAEKSNLRLNWAKMQPAPVADLLSVYMADQGNVPCVGGCKSAYPAVRGRVSGTPAGKEPLSFHAWLKYWTGRVETEFGKPADWACRLDERGGTKRSREPANFVPSVIRLEQAALRRGNLKPFHTFLVERMSQLSRDSLRERFGAGARERLTDLHQLVRFDIGDDQVRADTRLAFATGRLARAWLPEEDHADDAHLIQEIRTSIAEAVQQTPAKFKLWRHVLRAAARRPTAPDATRGGDTRQRNRDARRWLQTLLRLIRVEGEWARSWPQDAPQRTHCENRVKRTPLAQRTTNGRMAAYVRSAFWGYLAEAVRDVDNALKRTRHTGAAAGLQNRSAEWMPSAWTFRGLSEGDLQVVRDWLADIERWASVLYPSEASGAPDVNGAAGDYLPAWELEALALACLARVPRRVLIQAFEAPGPHPTVLRAGRLRLPDHPLLFPESSSIPAMLREKHRQDEDRLSPLDRAALLRLARADVGDESVVARYLAKSGQLPDQEAEESASTTPPADPASVGGALRVLSAAEALGVERHLPAEALQPLSAYAVALLEEIRAGIANPQGARQWWNLFRYARVRKALLGWEVPPSPTCTKPVAPTLHRLLWGQTWTHADVRQWPIELFSAPSIPLPVRISARMLREAVSDALEDPRSGLQNPTWVLAPGRLDVLSWGRRYQLGVGEDGAPPAGSGEAPWVKVASDGDAWEVYPHPAFLMPRVLRSGWGIHDAEPGGVRSNPQAPVGEPAVPQEGAQDPAVEAAGSVEEGSPAGETSGTAVPDAASSAAGDPKIGEPLQGTPGEAEGGAWAREVMLGLAAWNHVLLFLTAADGDERFLDQLLWHGPSAVPFAERWDLRGRIHLPQGVWHGVDQVLRAVWHRPSPGEMDEALHRLRGHLERIDRPPASHHDFRWERVDVRLELGNDFEMPQVVLPFGTSDTAPAPDLTPRITPDSLADTMWVRIGQVKASPAWGSFCERAPSLRRAEVQEIMREVAATAHSESHAAPRRRQGPLSHRSGLDILVLPEVTVPVSEERELVELARRTGTAVLAGLLWHEVRTAAVPHSRTTPARRYMVNEASLVVPMPARDDRGVPLVRTFRVRKPVPAHVEHALAKRMTDVQPGSRWSVLPGRRWYRFVHPRWADFSVAICSDLLDPTPWASMRGALTHVFMCAYNKDVDLFDALTWVRAYEHYVNVVATNHGSYGGSFIWTPKRRQEREVARLRGSNLFLCTDVELPVAKLYRQQRTGADAAVRKDYDTWAGPGGERGEEFKPPAPGYTRR